MIAEFPPREFGIFYLERMCFMANKQILFLLSNAKATFRLVIIVLLLAACAPQKAEIASEKRLISLAPNITELLFALGQKSAIVGVTTYCNYPPEAQAIEKIGDFSHPKIEKIVELKPTLVLLTGLEQENLRTQLETLSIPYLQIFPQNIASLQESIRLLGRQLGASAQADSLILAIQQGIGQIKLDSLAVRPRVFVEISGSPIMTIDNETLLGEIVKLAGGENIFPNLTRNFSRVSAELIVERDPEIIIVTYPTTENIALREGWENITAIQNNAIFTNINPDVLLRPGPRIVEGLQELHSIFAQTSLEKR